MRTQKKMRNGYELRILGKANSAGCSIWSFVLSPISSVRFLVSFVYPMLLPWRHISAYLEQLLRVGSNIFRI